MVRQSIRLRLTLDEVDGYIPRPCGPWPAWNAVSAAVLSNWGDKSGWWWWRWDPLWLPCRRWWRWAPLLPPFQPLLSDIPLYLDGLFPESILTQNIKINCFKALHTTKPQLFVYNFYQKLLLCIFKWHNGVISIKRKEWLNIRSVCRKMRSTFTTVFYC